MERVRVASRMPARRWVARSAWVLSLLLTGVTSAQVNRPPSISATPSVTAMEGNALGITVFAADPDQSAIVTSPRPALR